MIDIKALKENKQVVKDLILKKDPSFDVEGLLASDERLKAQLILVENLRCQRNELAARGKQGAIEEVRAEAQKLAILIKEEQERLQQLQEEFDARALRCPNIPQEDVPAGGKESNQAIKHWGKKPEFSFEPQHHVFLAEKKNWIDFDAAARMSGSHFALYRGELVSVMYALMLMMFKHNKSHGYEAVLPPYLVTYQALVGASNFPKFIDDVFSLEKDNLYLTPTAEVNLTNMYRDHVFASDELPKRMTSWTSCFRREAGGYGASERGIIRMHQFEKVELYAIVKPEDAAREHEKMLACAEEILQKLGLHYRVSLLAAQDCSFASAKTYDIEVWLPGQKEYKEVSSVSTCSDFQARRCALRYKETVTAKPNLVYTLNGSSLALPRLLVALLETYQTESGDILWPEVLKPYLDLL